MEASLFSQHRQPVEDSDRVARSITVPPSDPPKPPGKLNEVELEKIRRSRRRCLSPSENRTRHAAPPPLAGHACRGSPHSMPRGRRQPPIHARAARVAGSGCSTHPRREYVDRVRNPDLCRIGEQPLVERPPQRPCRYQERTHPVGVLPANVSARLASTISPIRVRVCTVALARCG